MPIWSFIRHGESQANAQGWFAGRVDTPLTPRGEQQAVAARPHLHSVAIDRVMASDLERARRTAELLLESSSLSIELVTPHLRERFCGDWEHREIAAIEATGDMKIFRSWAGRPPGGESLRDVAARVLPFLAGVEDQRDTLVVAHGALIRTIVGLLDNTAPEEIGAWRPANCEFVTRDVPLGRFGQLLATLP
ncbi:MAG: histidine phosphatase family protein [Myxococcales bacterium FL481]|nr:MAG: histidine phosphatase family protein [Myxococcales bacterium FL481]